jgi:hypothetical protein
MVVILAQIATRFQRRNSLTIGENCMKKFQSVPEKQGVQLLHPRRLRNQITSRLPRVKVRVTETWLNADVNHEVNTSSLCVLRKKYESSYSRGLEARLVSQTRSSSLTLKEVSVGLYIPKYRSPRFSELRQNSVASGG